MEEREKLALLEDMLEMEDGALQPDMKLSDLSEFDSMARLSLVVLFDDEFGKKLTGKDIDRFNTVGDILSEME